MSDRRESIQSNSRDFMENHVDLEVIYAKGSTIESSLSFFEGDVN